MTETIRFHRTCEWKMFTDGQPCTADASYRVARGRQCDAQDSCRRHLAVTVSALLEGENREVTVKSVSYA